MFRFSRRQVLAALSMAAVIAPIGSAMAAGDAPSDSNKRVALRGYDPVAYFTEGRPERGSPEFAAEFDDAIYWFKTAEHRAMFLDDPDRYAPQYAGYCAVTIARGAKLEADPEAWTISDGRLYVFGALKGVAMFHQQMAGIVEQANANWPALQKAP
jgi:hypothetical protein